MKRALSNYLKVLIKWDFLKEQINIKWAALHLTYIWMSFSGHSLRVLMPLKEKFSEARPAGESYLIGIISIYDLYPSTGHGIFHTEDVDASGSKR